MSTTCPVCQGPKSSRFDLCAECFSIHGWDRDEWSPVVTFLVADDNRLAWQDEQVDRYEVTFSDIAPDVEAALECGLISGVKIA